MFQWVLLHQTPWVANLVYEKIACVVLVLQIVFAYVGKNVIMTPGLLSVLFHDCLHYFLKKEQRNNN